jgi:hypothetical protein
MNKKHVVALMICLVAGINLFSQDQKNIIEFGVGIVPGKDYSIWVGDPVDKWATRKASPLVHLSFARQVREAFRIGGYVEYESGKFEMYSHDFKASRYNIGVNWLGQFPKNNFHLQLGGYFGYGLLKSKDWDQSLQGIDLGLLAGPAYENGNMGIALHVQSGMGWYYSAGNPQDVTLLNPKFVLKVYYKF